MAMKDEEDLQTKVTPVVCRKGGWMGFFDLFGTCGALVLTNHRFMFLTAGRMRMPDPNDAWGGASDLQSGPTRGSDALDDSYLRPSHLFEIPLGKITAMEMVRSMGVFHRLHLAYTDAKGVARTYRSTGEPGFQGGSSLDVMVMEPDD